ncbi:DNA/RNA polymerase [Cenococcum geophilum 1.58]|uniref:DNA/RNA polymerase n=1 Tax=Cenococcum geophilum 1.58 TaxID=794803 RepID=UPI00358F840C|nr:DNA/RNA polymerase [Cenococcum geophilum 1.58]
MLLRAARRQIRRDAFQRAPQGLEQLSLPWLCPAQMRWTASGTIATVQSSDARRHKLPRPVSPRTKSRSLATASDILPPQFDEIPLEDIPLADHAWSTHRMPRGVSDLDHWDPAHPLIIHNSLAIAPPRLNFKNGIGGDPAELHQNLHACLRVGRLDRAAALVRRLTDLYSPMAPEIVGAHNLYLGKLLEFMHNDRPDVSIEDMEKWYNNEMMRRDVQPDAQTLVIMLRASIAFLTGLRRDESIRNFLELAKSAGPDTFEKVNTSAEFSVSEWDMLVNFQPDQFDELDSVDNHIKYGLSTPLGRALAIEKGYLPDPSLKVKPVNQKGFGLKTLNEALSMFEPGKGVAYPHQIEGSKEDKDRAFAYMRQLRLEENAVDAAVERWRAENDNLQKIGIHGVLKTKPIEALMWQWYSALLPSVQQELKEVKEVLSTPEGTLSSDRHIYGPYLELFGAEKLAAIAIIRILQAFAADYDSHNSVKVSSITTAIGGLLELEYGSRTKNTFSQGRRSLIRQKILSRLTKGRYKFSSPQRQEVNPEQAVGDIVHKEFPTHIKARIGAFLVEKVLQSATITVCREDPKTGETLTSIQPAFSHGHTYQKGKKIGKISAHYDLVEKLGKEPIKGFASFRLPMLVEPKLWTSYKDGGYYRYPTTVVRAKGGDEAQRAYAVSAAQKGDLDQIFAGLDVLGKTPWQINRDVFKVMLQAWNDGEGIGELVPEKLDIKYPSEPAKDASRIDRMLWMKKMKSIEAQKSGFHSNRCFQNFQLEIARSYLNETFYYPHNVDFRGRAYPIPPALNHMGADIARGLLKFAKGKELGTVGLQWLKIHLANLHGFDKASLKEREEFAMEHLDQIYDSATNPLSGSRWWLTAEDPWQCLACCMELKNALDSPDPTRYISYLPVHQDGTCNGLQHYAALGGDKVGASQVNLEPSDRPQDIYTGVAELVRSEVAKDAEAGIAIAKFLNGKISRRVVKRTVMTNVYGVTFGGARMQVLTELKDIFPNFESTPQILSLLNVAGYVAKQIFKALSQIFNGAHDIQYWLGECAGRISTSITAEQIKKVQQHSEGKAQLYDSKFRQKPLNERGHAKVKQDLTEFKSSVIWTTPLKMPVVQPYRKGKVSQVKTCLQGISVHEPRASDAVSKRKQLQAFPPNFIHSLDATHMILSALKCDEVGLTFAAVHDSFWSHAADIPSLNQILRDAFVRMHSEDIIGRLAAEFKARYAGSMYLATLSSNTAVAQEIMALRLSLSRARQNGGKQTTVTATLDEVLMEEKRQRLLNSENPEERKMGEEMITPASIYEAARDPTAIISDSEPSILGETTGSKAKRVQSKIIDAELSEKEGHAFNAGSVEIRDTLDKNDPESITEEEVEGLEGLEDHEDDAPLDKANKKEKSKEKRYLGTGKNIQVWLPLTFPPVPKKGDFDVSRLKDSKYFFS